MARSKLARRGGGRNVSAVLLKRYPILKRDVRTIPEKELELWVVAVVAQAALFGLAHTYLGLSGGVSAAFSALTNGVFFLVAGRNLWPVVLVHGMWDSAVITLLYMHGVPST